MAISTAVDASAVARVLGIKTIFKDRRAGGVLFLPQRLAIIGQGASAAVYSNVKAQVTSALEAATLYGFGSPIHLAMLQLKPANGDGVGTIPVTIYALDDAAGSVAAAGALTPSGAVTKAGEFRVKINNILSASFSVAVGDSVATIVTAATAAIAAELNLPMLATDSTTKVDLTAKWKGISGNDLQVEVQGPTDTGVTWAVVQPAGGLVNPDVQPALDQVGNVWETMILNCLNISDTTALDAYSNFGEGRWGALIRKPLVVMSGNNEVSRATATTLTDSRKTDRVNVQLVAPGSNDLPFVIAARQLARIAVLANNNPPHDYGSQQATGLIPGADGSQWDYADRDAAVKAGSSTIEVRDGVVNISDVVTMYHPTGDPLPAYRYVVDIVRLQNVIFNLDLEFGSSEWDGAPLIPDADPTVNPLAKKPKTARAAAGLITDSLGLEAIISDAATTKANTLAEIDAGNPKRLNMVVPVQLSGNTNIKSIDLEFGFFFGSSTVVT